MSTNAADATGSQRFARVLQALEKLDERSTEKQGARELPVGLGAEVIRRVGRHRRGPRRRT